jgi:hypothetical protein
MGLIYVISGIICFFLFWLFGDFLLYASLVGVVGSFLILKGVRRYNFIYLEVILLGGYLVGVFLCLLFPGLRTFKLFISMIGVWFIITVFFLKRL